MPRTRKVALLGALADPGRRRRLPAQARDQREGAQLLEQVISARQRPLRRHAPDVGRLREGRARSREGAQRSVQRAAHAEETCKQFNSRTERPLRRPRHADRAEPQTQVVTRRDGLSEHAGRRRRRSRRRPHRQGRHRCRRAAGRSTRSPTRSSARRARRSTSRSRAPACRRRSSERSRAR